MPEMSGTLSDFSVEAAWQQGKDMKKIGKENNRLSVKLQTSRVSALGFVSKLIDRCIFNEPFQSRKPGKTRLEQPRFTTKTGGQKDRLQSKLRF